MTPQVSICIPTYNQGQYLAVAIRSALEQDLESVEVVVSDNHSTDETSVVLAGIKDERLRIIRPERHLCMAENFDFCVRASTGRYVTILCSDDTLYPSYARLLSASLDEHTTASVAYSAAYIVDEDRGTRHVERHLGGSFCRSGSEEMKRFLRGAGCVFPTMMMRRECYDTAGGFYREADAGGQASVIDWDIQLRLLHLGDVAYVDGALAEFRVWTSGERQGRLLRLIEDTAKLYDTRVKEMVEVNPALRAEAESARRTRALVLACGLNQLGRGSEFKEGVRLILKLSDSGVVRWMVLLQSYGMAGFFAALFHLYEKLRWVVKATLSWSSREASMDHGVVREPAGNTAVTPPGLESTSGILRVTYGVLANLLGQVITAVGQLLLVPVFLGYWGQQLYGEWLSLSAAVTYLSMLDFGMQTYLVNRLNQCYVRGDYKEHSRMLHSALLFSVVLSASAMALMLVVISLIPIEKWFVFSQTSHRTSVLVEMLLCMQVVGAVPFGLMSGCYRSIREYARGQMVNNVRTFASLALTMAVVAAGRGLAVVAAAQLLVLVGSAVWVCADLRIRHPEIAIGLRAANMRQAISFLGPSSLFFLIQAAAALTIQGSVLMVSALFGAASVAVFVSLRTLANVIRQMVGALHSALWPEVTALETAHQYAALRSVHLMTSKVVVIGSVCTAMILHFMAREVISVWTHHDNIFDAGLLDAFLILLVSQSPWLTSSLVLAASNNHRRLSICYFVSAAAGLGLGLVAARWFGMAGIVYGMCLGEYMACGWIIVWTACRLMHENILHFAANVLGRAIPFSILLYAMVSALFHALPDGPELVRLMVFGMGSILLSLLLSVFICFDRRERGQISKGVLTTLRSWKPLSAEEA